MTISLTVNMWHRTTKLEALLDCGATHNFIDPRTIKTLAMGTNLLKRPLLVHNVDGTINQGVLLLPIVISESEEGHKSKN